MISIEMKAGTTDGTLLRDPHLDALNRDPCYLLGLLQGLDVFTFYTVHEFSKDYYEISYQAYSASVHICAWFREKES